MSHIITCGASAVIHIVIIFFFGRSQEFRSSVCFRAQFEASATLWWHRTNARMSMQKFRMTTLVGDSTSLRERAKEPLKET